MRERRTLIVVVPLCGALLIAAVASAGRPKPVTERWACQGTDGTVVATHPDESHARASCQERAQGEAGGVFIVVPVAAVDTPTVKVPAPVVLKTRPCDAPGPCTATLPLSGRRGSWAWTPPTQLENGNIVTDLTHFSMFRQPFDGKPEEIAVISPKVTNVFWGMDTRDANACFWIEAVRVNSKPMASDRSNRICLNEAGDLLPQA
ncbi:MAG: hypothetical protein ABIX37_02660 [Gammaproteobacteria bacterium]